MWQGSAVAVKIIEVRSGLALEGNEGMHSGSNSLDSGGADDTGASTGNAPLVEAVLSKALHHPHIVSWGVMLVGLGRWLAGGCVVETMRAEWPGSVLGQCCAGMRSVLRCAVPCARW
jgi:hypothetical protein